MAVLHDSRQAGADENMVFMAAIALSDAVGDGVNETTPISVYEQLVGVVISALQDGIVSRSFVLPKPSTAGPKA